MWADVCVYYAGFVSVRNCHNVSFFICNVNTLAGTGSPGLNGAPPLRPRVRRGVTTDPPLPIINRKKK